MSISLIPVPDIDAATTVRDLKVYFNNVKTNVIALTDFMCGLADDVDGLTTITNANQIAIANALTQLASAMSSIGDINAWISNIELNSVPLLDNEDDLIGYVIPAP